MAKKFEIRNSTAEFLTFVAEGKEQGIQVLYKDETVWATQKAMSVLFYCSADNICLHLKNICDTNELNKEATTEKISVVQQEGAREVRRNTLFYNLDAILPDAGMTKEEFDDMVNLLGNKILLEEDINKHIGMDWFKTKKGTLVQDKKGYVESCFGIASALSSYPSDKWGKADIEKANEKIAQRISRFIFNDLKETEGDDER